MTHKSTFSVSVLPIIGDFPGRHDVRLQQLTRCDVASSVTWATMTSVVKSRDIQRPVTTRVAIIFTGNLLASSVLFNQHIYWPYCPQGKLAVLRFGVDFPGVSRRGDGGH